MDLNFRILVPSKIKIIMARNNVKSIFILKPIALQKSCAKQEW